MNLITFLKALQPPFIKNITHVGVSETTDKKKKKSD